jgi:ribosomal protein S18 acetylase RimI-like enzyme
MATLHPYPDIGSKAVRFRECAGLDDAAAIAAIHAARKKVDGVDPSDSYEEYVDLERAKRWLTRVSEAGELPLYVIVELRGNPVGFGYIETWKEEDGTNVYLLVGNVVPDARGLGLGSALLAWLEGEAMALSDRDAPGEKREFAANASSTEMDAARLLADSGYRAGYVLVELRLDPVKFSRAKSASKGLPPGTIEALPSTSDFTAISEAVRDAFAKESQAGRFAEVVDPLEYAAELGNGDRDPSLWRIARGVDHASGGRSVVAAVLPDVRKGIAWITEVATVPEWRRKGIARALLIDAIEGLLARGVPDIRLCTMEQFKTRAIDLYESVGFARYKEFPRYRKPMVSV